MMMPAVSPQRRLAIQRADIGLVPFLTLLPFMYVPKLLEGDTQPWVLLGAVFALFTYRPQAFVHRRDLGVLVVVLLALAAYVARAGFVIDAIRAAYIYLTFAVIWLLAQRGGHDYFRLAIKYTLTVWFFVGIYQYIAVLLGFAVEFTGRYVEGRSGVPSLTAEPSYFGSLSVLMAMYLLNDLRRNDWGFIAMAVLNVLLCGSVLAILLLGFVFLVMRPIVQIVLGSVFAGLIVLDAAFNTAGLSARFAMFKVDFADIVSILIDPSLNLRWGHIEFTLISNFWNSVFFLSPVSFESQYNDYVNQSFYLIATGSNFILPMAGELIYGGGFFGLMLIFIFMRRGYLGGPTMWQRLVRAGFVLACLLNPVSIANPLFVYFVLQARPSGNATD